MVSGDNVTVTLTGGSPWGFRLTGGGSLPLQIAKIRKKSQAHAQGIQEGDAVVSINGIPVHDKSHDEAVGLIDGAGDTLTLQIYRGDPDDLGQLLASTKPHAPVLPPQAEGGVLVTSSTSTTDDGGRRREVQERVFVTTDGDTESTTFVRREHTTTTITSSSGDVNGNDVGGAGTGSGGIGNLTTQIEVSTAFQSSAAPTLSVSPKPATSPKPTVSLKPVSPVPFAPVAAPAPPQSVMVTFAPQPVSIQPKHDPTWVAKPTFKAVAPKLAPSVAPKPAPLQPIPQGPAKPHFNAKAAAGGGGAAPPTFSPQKFQATASAMYTPFGGPQQQPQPQMQVKFQQQAFSSPPQQNGIVVVGGGGGGRGGKPHPSPFSPMNLSSPVSPAASQPLSPSSGYATPMFNVRNNVSEGPRGVWQPNMWLPGQEPDSAHHPHQQQPIQQQQQQQNYAPPPPQQQSKNENIEVPRRMTVKERQQMLLNQAARNNHSLSARQADPDFDAPPEEVQRMHSHRLKVFGPPVEMTVQGPYDLDLVRTDSVESEGSSPTSSLHRKKKLYADSAFYEDPSHKYPTIEEQMRLCRLISHSLTSAANRRARGAKMFAKRKRKSSKWVHEGGHSEWSSSGGVDVANIEDLESELDVDEGGSKQLFMFRIPNLKHRVVSPERNTKMSMKKDEFERYRLQAQKCEHRTVSPGTCFDIAADLKAHKGRGGRLFERRKNRADKFIIDESNAKMAGPKHTKLDNLLGGNAAPPLKSSKSPWEAAQEGNVDTAFHHLDDMQRLQKMNQILKYTPPKPAPVPQPTREVQQPALHQPAAFKGPRSDLRSSSTLPLLKGRDFNRYARGWCPAGADFPDRAESMAATQNHHHAAPPPQLHAAAQDYPVEHAAAARRGAPHNRSVHFGDYNPRPKAWQNAADAGPSSYSCPASMSASWASSDFDSMYHPHHSPAGAAAHAVYAAPDELPASDL